MRDSGEFSLVTRRKKRAFHVRNNQTNPNVSLAEYDDNESDTDYDHEALIGKLLEAETELTSTSYADGVFYCFKESLNALEVNGISDIVCYGLGHFSSRRSSKYQLALLLTLKRHYGSEVYIYDPIFSSKEIRLLKRLGFNVIKTNEEGRRVVHDKVTLLYMPHCSKYLTNNFLYTNWSKNLSKCILLTNSFSVVVGDSLETNTSCPIDYVSRIRPYVTEIAVKNNFMYEEAFNDLNIHVFLKRDIDTVPKNFWTDRGEPRYQDAVVDYLTAMQTERVKREMNPNGRLIRSLVREIRGTSTERNAKNNIVAQYVLEQAKAHRETSETLCKAREELKSLAEMYLCYLRSRRMCKEIQVRYTGKGERSIRETADLVGFKLPHDPK